MHDPMTVAFEIRYPWCSRLTSNVFPDGYRESFATIWHVDPEADGSDDSCGYMTPRLTKRQLEILDSMAWSEAREPYLQAAPVKRLDNPIIAHHLMCAALLQVADALDVPITHDEASQFAYRLTANQIDNLRRYLCHVPGYHTNDETDTEHGRRDHARDLYSCVARFLLRRQRRWWQHPRWHVWHWKLQIHPLQTLKRWLWSRCCWCHKGFSWQESRGGVIGYSWGGGDGPQWFRSEQKIAHFACDHGARPVQGPPR